MMTSVKQWIARVAVVTLFVGVGTAAQAQTYYVAQNHPQASDSNPGTEELPWRTLTQAANVAEAGDTVWLKAGVYQETLQPYNSGSAKEPITFQAYGDDPVFITSPKTTVTGWQKVEGMEKVYQAPCPVPGSRVFGPASPVLAVDGKAVPGRGGQWALGVRDLEEITDETVNRFVLDGDNLKLNIGGDDPNNHVVEVVRRDFAAIVLKASHIIVRGLQMIDVNAGVLDGGEYNVVEDCVVRDAWNDFVWDCAFTHDGAKFGVFRRCTVINSFRGAFTSGGRSCLVEECLAVHTGTRIPNRVAPEDTEGAPGWEWGCAYHLSQAKHNVHRYNVAVDNASFGWWSDIKAYGAYAYGNLLARSGTGLYNEALCNDATHMYNVCLDNSNGFVWRYCHRLLGEYNYIADNNTGVAVWSWFSGPSPTDNIFRRNIVLRSDTAVNVGRWTHTENLDGRSASEVQNEITGRADAAYTDRPTNEWDVFEDNFYTLNPEGVFLRLPPAAVPYWPDPGIGEEYQTLADYQTATGKERGSHQREVGMEEFGLGLYTVRIPNSSQPHKPLPIVGNPIRTAIHYDPLPAMGDEDPYFWKPSDQPFDVQPSDPFASRASWAGVELRWSRRPYFPPEQGPRLKLDAPAVVWLTAIGKGPEDFQDDAAGWWSPSLPTVPGAKIRFSFLVAAENLEAPTEDGVVAWVRFSSATNQYVTRQFVLGKNGEGELVEGGPYQGTFPWRKVSATVVAPEKAERFAVFFGVRPCKGMARFADIDIQTEPGEPPTEDEPEITGKAGAMDLEEEVRKFIREQAND